MKDNIKLIKLWTCPQCGRQFERTGQSHSCRPFPLKQHFDGKPRGRLLFGKFKQAFKKRTGSFKIESLACCIHFVSTFTFAAVKILKDKIRVDFSLDCKIKRKRIQKSVRMSANRCLYYVDVNSDNEIDEELMGWIQKAHDKKETPT